MFKPHSKYDVIVIGAGLFGSVVADALRLKGMSVLNIDDKQPLAGSGPAACLMKPSWFSSMGADKSKPALEMLDKLYGVQDIPFSVGYQSTLKVGVTVHWIPPKKILHGQSTLWAKVDNIRKTDTGFLVCMYGEDIECTRLIVAAGIWCNELLRPLGHNVEYLKARWGCAFTWQGQINPFIRPYAPYRQVAAFNREPNEIWVGDGTALVNPMTQEQVDKSLLRCGDFAGMRGQPMPKVLMGARPYVEKQNAGVVKELEKNLWVVTGGAKNGTIGAGYCAHVVSEAV